jgi:hypothetical protein
MPRCASEAGSLVPPNIFGPRPTYLPVHGPSDLAYESRVAAGGTAEDLLDAAGLTPLVAPVPPPATVIAGPRHRQPQSPPLFSSGFRYGLILFAHAAADLKRLYHVTIALERDAPGGDHHLAVIRGVDAEKWPARLGIRGENLGDEIEGSCGTRILTNLRRLRVWTFPK